MAEDASAMRLVQDAEYAESLVADQVRHAVAAAITSLTKQSGHRALVLVFPKGTVHVGTSGEQLWTLLAPRLRPLPLDVGALEAAGATDLSELIRTAQLPDNSVPQYDGMMDLGNFEVGGAERCRVVSAADPAVIAKTRRAAINEARLKALAPTLSGHSKGISMAHKRTDGSLLTIVVHTTMAELKTALTLKGVVAGAESAIHLARKDCRYLFRDPSNRAFRVVQ